MIKKRAVAAYLAFIGTDLPDDWEPACAALKDSRRQPMKDYIAQGKNESQALRRRQTLNELIAEACQRFKINVVDFDSPVRDAYLAKARAWIADQATQRGVASRSAVAPRAGAALSPHSDTQSVCTQLSWTSRAATSLQSRESRPGTTTHMLSITASPNSLHFTSFAPSIRRAKS